MNNDGYNKMVILNSKMQEEWDALDEKTKKGIKSHLARSVEKMENRLAIETMACVINDMQKEIEELKDKIK